MEQLRRHSPSLRFSHKSAMHFDHELLLVGQGVWELFGLNQPWRMARFDSRFDAVLYAFFYQDTSVYITDDRGQRLDPA